MRFFKFLISLFLIPACIATVAGLMSQVFSLGGSHLLIYFIIGFVSYLILQTFLFTPLRIYILGHELTHALWSLAFGGKVKKLRVFKNRGEVQLTKVNFLITLAPYFFPFYTFLILAIYYSVNFFYPLKPLFSLLIFLIGFSWSFHLSLCFFSLRKEQSDLQKGGLFFSVVIIWLMNIIVLSLILGWTMIDFFSIREFFQVSYITTREIWKWLFSHGKELVIFIIDHLKKTS
ncbi:hypothetical protein KAI68_04655 [bacterium]|nr:hypothetical protein [bacterium]